MLGIKGSVATAIRDRGLRVDSFDTFEQHDRFLTGEFVDGHSYRFIVDTQARTLTLEQATAVRFDQWLVDRNCSQGYSCGNSCISKSKACLKKLTTEQRDAVNRLKGSARVALSREFQGVNQEQPDIPVGEFDASGNAIDEQEFARQQEAVRKFLEENGLSVGPPPEPQKVTTDLGGGISAETVTRNDISAIRRGEKLGGGMLGSVHVTGDGEATKIGTIDEDLQVLQRMNDAGVGPRTTAVLQNEGGSAVGLRMEKLDFQTLESSGGQADADALTLEVGKMHNAGVFHGDLHFRNVGFDGDRPIIMDWGESQIIPPTNSKRSRALVRGELLNLADAFTESKVSANGPASEALFAFAKTERRLHRRMQRLKSPSRDRIKEINQQRDDALSEYLAIAGVTLGNG